MESMKLSEIARALNGELINCSEDEEISSIAIKSFKVKPGNLYITLLDKSSDPSEPVEAAIRNGALAIITPSKTKFDIPQIVVDDTWIALEQFAKYYMSKFNIPKIMITGSSGKTSTKDIVASVLGEKFKVHKTQQNDNSNLGIPYTIFHMKTKHEISVFEVGMDDFGQIDAMVNLVRPSIVAITNIGTAHIENLLTKENIFKAKMEITNYLSENDVLIINADDEYLSGICNKHYKIIRISTEGKGDYNAFDIVNLGEAGIQFKCNYKGKVLLLNLNAIGIHNVYNALYAIVIADIFNLDSEQVRKGLIKFKTSNLRMKLIQLKNNIKILEDCYNANPESMKYALDSLNSFRGCRRIAILGDMLELGHLSEEAHREIGKYVLGKCDMIIAIGNNAQYIFEESRNMTESSYFKTKEEALGYIKSTIRKDDVILVKGSRGMELEYIVESLKLN